MRSPLVGAINQTVVNAFKRVYMREQLETALTTASADLISGVQITRITFEGGGADGRPISGAPDYIVEHLEVAIAQLDEPSITSRPNSAFMDLSRRPWGT